MSGIKDTATVTLNVNGAQAKQMMGEVSQKILETRAKIISMQESMADPKAIEKTRKELKKYEKQLEEMKSATEGVKSALGSLDTATPRQLEKALKTLNKQLKDMPPGTEVWNSHIEQIKTLKSRLAELNEEVKEQESAWDKFKSWSTGAWPAIDLINQWGGSITGVARDCVDAFASMDQEMANVRKFTGMSAEQVADLNEEFKKMDTRTSREDLNKLAQEAGRLGKSSKEDILGFVRAADQINVALDDLGEGATLTLSKLTGIFGDEARYGTEQSLLKVGSVINELSQNCSASAPYLAEFASRLGGVGAQANMSIPQIMGFAAVLDSNAQQVEASATAVSQVLVRMMADPAKYAKVAGLDVQRFTEMLKTDANGALILFLETLQKAGGMDVLSPMFRDMGENGARAITALSTLATHIDEVKAQQEAANQAFIDGTSIGDEFAVQNSTVQAGLDKCRKAANELKVELGERLAPLMAHIMTSTSALIRAGAVIVDFLLEHKGAIITLCASIAAYNIAANLAVIKTKLFSVAIATQKGLMVAWTATTKLAAVAGALLTGNIVKARAAWVAFSAMLKASPLGLAAAAVTALVGTIVLLTKKTKEVNVQGKILAETQKKISDAEKEAEANCAVEIVALDALYKATQDQSLAMADRVAAVKQLQEQYPDYFKNLSQEAILAGDAADAYDRLRKNIVASARAEARKSILTETATELESLISDRDAMIDPLISGISDDNISSVGEFSKYSDPKLRKYGAFVRLARIEDADAMADDVAAVLSLQEKIDAKQAALDKLSEKVSNDVITNLTSDNDDDGGYKPYVSDKDKKKQEAEAKREAAKAKKEFKAQLDAYKAQKTAADAEALALYRNDSIDYEELMSRRHDAELDYYNDSIALFEKTFADQKDTYLQDDKDYQALLLAKTKAEDAYLAERTARELEAVKRWEAAQTRDAQHMYSVKSNPTIADEIKLQAELFNIRKTSLERQQALYKEGSKEYADLAYKIETLVDENTLAQKKLYFKAVEALRSEYDKKSAAERYALEKKTLDLLLKEGVLTLKEYEKFIKGLKAKYEKELPGGESSKDSYIWSDQDQEKFDKQKAELSEALENGTIGLGEYYQRLANLEEDRRNKIISGIRSVGGEWNGLIANIYGAYKDFLDALVNDSDNKLGKLANLVGAVSSAVGAGMQIATEFSKAEAEIQIKAIEDRYDREVKLAQGNAYKVAKAEKKKEQETAKVKNDASKRQYVMQVVQAVAQSIQAGLNAYSATAAIPIVGPTLAPIAMGIALAQGAVQVALLKKQQQAAAAQGYSKGGFTKPGSVDEPAGVVHAGEWVASQKLLANPVARPLIDALDLAQRTNTIGSLRAEDVSRSIRANDSLVRIAESDDGSSRLVAAAIHLSNSASALNERLNEPFVTVNTVTGDKGIKQAQDDYDRLLNNVTPKSKRK